MLPRVLSLDGCVLTVGCRVETVYVCVGFVEPFHISHSSLSLFCVSENSLSSLLSSPVIFWLSLGDLSRFFES